jgi:phenylalanine-4-hydroxylase
LCHELLGHVPLFANKEFAEFSQEIGLASLGVSDEDIQKLATIYWFTVEFGLCHEDEGLRAFGAGLLSSFGELSYCMTDQPKRLPFDPNLASVTSYPITEYQPVYFVAESFPDAKEKVRRFAQTLHRSFMVHYNPFTQSIEFMDKKEKVLDVMSSIRTNLDACMLALKRWKE